MSLRLERLLAMDAAIRGGSYPNVTTFMRRFEVSERTVRGDLAFMRERLNAPLEHDRERGGYYNTDPTWMIPTMSTTEGELLAFFLSVQLTRRYRGSTFGEPPLRSAVTNLSLRLPAKLLLDWTSLRSAINCSKHTERFGVVAVVATPTFQTSLIELMTSLEVMRCLAASRVRKSGWSRRSRS